MVFFSACDFYAEMPVKIRKVDSKLESYLQDFESEAESRGINLKYNTLVLKIEDVPTEKKTVVANTRNYGNGHFRISIDPDLFLEDEDQIEKSIFHEFGHAFLSRGHVNYKSIMKQGKISYNQDNRDAFLDELFKITDEVEI